MNFYSDDEQSIKKSYVDFLSNLMGFILNQHINNAFDIFKTYNKLLNNGKFSENNKFVFDDKYKYLHIENMQNGIAGNERNWLLQAR